MRYNILEKTVIVLLLVLLIPPFVVSQESESYKNQWFIEAKSQWLKKDIGNNIILAEQRTYDTNALVNMLSTQSVNFNHKSKLALKIGRTFNKWLSMEASYYGIYHWQDSKWIKNKSKDPDIPNQFYSIGLIGLSQNFSAINRVDFSTSTELYNFELGVRYKSSSFFNYVLTAFRYIYIKDKLILKANGVYYENSISDQSDVETTNKILAWQIGSNHALEFGNFVLSLSGKWGLGFNFNNMDIVEKNNGFLNGNLIDLNGETTSLCSLLDLNLSTRVMMGTHISFFGSYQLLYVNGLSLAAYQILLLGNASSMGLEVTESPVKTNHKSTMKFYGFNIGCALHW